MKTRLGGTQMHATRTRLLLVAMGALTLLLLPGAAHANQIIFTLASSSLSGAPGTTVTFQGSIQNAGAPTVFLNGDSSTTASGFLSINDTAFFNNVPLSLDPSFGVGPVDLFSVLIDPSTPFGTYSLNLFNIVGGPDAVTQNLLATQTFTVIVAPEPSSVLLMMAAGLCLLCRRQKAAA